MIPIAPGKHPVSDTATYARRITRYKVHSGDTVESVAENFGVSPQMLRRWNGLRGDSLRGRKVLALHLPVTPSARERTPQRASASRARGHRRSKTRKRHQPSRRDQIARQTNDEDRPRPPRVVHHKVKSGETLYSIASAYKTTVAALKRDNRNVASSAPA